MSNRAVKSSIHSALY